MYKTSKVTYLKERQEKLRKQVKTLHKQKPTEIIKAPTHFWYLFIYKRICICAHEKGITKILAPTNPNQIVQIVNAYYQNNHQSKSKLENLEPFYNVTHLYLQWNKITRLEGLDGLRCLKKLYLGNNKISVVEKLEGFKYLEELHIEKQNLDSTDALCFDPRTLKQIGDTLRILNVSENKQSDISWVKPLRHLEVLVAKKNMLHNYKTVADYLSTQVSLVEIDFSGNPMNEKHHYRETIIARCPQIRLLDNIVIPDTLMQKFDNVLRQINEKDKTETTRKEVDKFFNLNMLPGPSAHSALHMSEPCDQKHKGCKTDSRDSNASGPRDRSSCRKYTSQKDRVSKSKFSPMAVTASDSANMFMPRVSWRNQTALSAREGIAPPLELPPQQPHDGIPIKGILKKPLYEIK